ncbi:MAG: adenylate/guanylate cyclase domain-containing protein [Planctomycetes bacterium]|nr:adenylate/guanylate cyclase domain-containing protein [Planctomycetota bacterium]
MARQKAAKNDRSGDRRAKTVRLDYLPDGRKVESHADETILHASLRAGIPHTHVCGGKARCSTCRVVILGGKEYCLPRNLNEKELADKLGFSPEIRLACQTRATGNVKLRRLVLDAEDIQLATEQRTPKMPVAVGQEKHVAIMFADIRGFTSFAEKLLPYDVIHVLNRHFHEMGAVIQRHGGHIDNYTGDGFMALFGVQDPTDAPLRAVRAGLEMLQALERLKPYMESIHQKSFDIGIGVHYGQAVLGTIGAEHKRDLTAIGDAVNFASRVEAANKKAGTRFRVSDAAYAQVKAYVRVGSRVNLVLPGKSGEHTLYEIVGLK